METHIENWKEKLAGMIVVWAKDDLIRTPIHPVLESFIESLISQEREDMQIQERERAVMILHKTIMSSKNLEAIDTMEQVQREILSAIEGDTVI